MDGSTLPLRRDNAGIVLLAFSTKQFFPNASPFFDFEDRFKIIFDYQLRQADVPLFSLDKVPDLGLY